MSFQLQYNYEIIELLFFRGFQVQMLSPLISEIIFPHGLIYLHFFYLQTKLIELEKKIKKTREFLTSNSDLINNISFDYERAIIKENRRLYQNNLGKN